MYLYKEFCNIYIYILWTNFKLLLNSAMFYIRFDVKISPNMMQEGSKRVGLLMYRVCENVILRFGAFVGITW